MVRLQYLRFYHFFSRGLGTISIRCLEIMEYLICRVIALSWIFWYYIFKHLWLTIICISNFFINRWYFLHHLLLVWILRCMRVNNWRLLEMRTLILVVCSLFILLITTGDIIKCSNIIRTLLYKTTSYLLSLAQWKLLFNTTSMWGLLLTTTCIIWLLHYYIDLSVLAFHILVLYFLRIWINYWCYLWI